ncbi:MAG: DUF4954 family protein [Bacteroidaceae bacterium]
MNTYRPLTGQEISILEANSCWAEDWNRVRVAPGFAPQYMHRVMLYGDIELGAFNEKIEVSQGFAKHTGICNATLRNVRVGDNCLIENIGNYINNYTIGCNCYISNVCTMETTREATFGEGNTISVLNEVGEGNVILFRGLNSQLAALMVKYATDAPFTQALTALVRRQIEQHRAPRGLVDNGVRIVNTRTIINTVMQQGCVIDGVSRLKDCTLLSSPTAHVCIGTGVICEDSIVSDGSVITNSVKMQDCFVGESCKVTNGFAASQSVFFANSFMSNGEACAAFCGPFSSSHHKSSLLIGGQFSFYNAGSATNFSNHAYKMGPMHYGILERGTKTASGAYILMPAHIGTFSVCFGKLMYHPDTRSLPFSYLIAYGDVMYLSPGRNITTVGLYRDIRKWPKRDMRVSECQKSIVNFDWLSPFSVGEILQGKRILERLREASGDNVSTYNYHEYVINASSLRKGIKYYDIALRIYMGAVLKRVIRRYGQVVPPTSSVGEGEWTDLSGMLLPLSEELRIRDAVTQGRFASVEQLLAEFDAVHAQYRDSVWRWTYRMILDYYGLQTISPEDVKRIHHEYVQARRAWITEIRKDAEKEFAMGDVEPGVLEDFLTQLDHEVDYEEA